MNVPVQILENLKCSNCEDLLSCGPVLIKNDGSDICGRCSNLENPAVPNKPYNELAEMCMFPCKYEAAGCFEKISFSCMKQHEAGCEFRTYICPVMSSGSCEWIGARNKILEHTRDTHPEKVMEHPCEIEHDIKTTSLKTFLTTVFDVLFLVYVKVCLTTHTIYYSVRRIGEEEDRRVFKYQIHIENDSGTLTKKGEVAPQGCLAMQEDTSITVKINTLIEALNGFKDVKFVVTLQEFMKCYKCKKINNSDQTEVCDKINNIFYCKACSVSYKSCTYATNGCSWKGNARNHSNLFCTSKKLCTICNEDIKEFNLLEHYRRKNHTNYNHLYEKYWKIEKDKRTDITISLQNVSYFFMYNKYENSLNAFSLQGRPGAVNRTKFVLVLRNPKTKFASHYVMNEFYSFNIGQFAWQLKLHDDKLKSFIDDDKFDVGFDIYSNI